MFNHAPNKPPSHTAYFFQQGVSRSLLFWLLFRRSLCQPQWAQAAREGLIEAPLGQAKKNDIANYNDEQLLRLWLPKQQGYTYVEYDGGQWLALLGLLLGFGSMSAALAYGGERPVNLWVLLGGFALLPFGMSLLTFTTSLIRRDTYNHYWVSTVFKPWLNSILAQFKPFNFEAEATSNRAQNHLIKMWLLWKLQWFALTFQLSAIITFVIMVTFQQYSFAWFSTNIEQGELITNLLQNLSLPWQWALSPPTHEFIASSRFTLGHAEYEATTSGAWWSYLSLAMIVYGLIPRLLVILWIRFNIQKRLTREIYNSGEVERFIKALRLTTPKPTAPLNTEGLTESLVGNNIENHTKTTTTPNTTTPKTTSNNITQRNDNPNGSLDRHYIAWQENVHTPVSCAHTIGNASWQQDEAWVVDNSPLWQAPLCLVVKQAQTPTAELADLLILAQSNNKTLYIELLLLTSELNKSTELKQGQRASWKHFSEQYKINLTTLPETPERDDD